jgi:tetratricopeptide (TPR) repeat protein
LPPRERAMAQFILGVAAVGLSDYERAIPSLSAAYDGLRQLKDEYGIALASVPLGVGSAIREPAGPAEGLLRAALDTFRSRKDTFGISYAIFGLGRVLAMQKRFDEAIVLNEESAAALREAGELMLRGMTLLNLAWARIATGDLEGAERAVDEALTSLTSLQYYEGLARAFEAATALWLRRGDPGRALSVFGAAEGIRASVGARVWALDQSLHDEMDAGLRSLLGDEAFESGFAEGVSLPVSQAVDLARSV